jgi:hypothetical protein
VKYQVVYRIAIEGEIFVDAESEDEAQGRVENMAGGILVGNALSEELTIEEIYEVKP